jgi:hypothetical protein
MSAGCRSRLVPIKRGRWGSIRHGVFPHNTGRRRVSESRRDREHRQVAHSSRDERRGPNCDPLDRRRKIRERATRPRPGLGVTCDRCQARGPESYPFHRDCPPTRVLVPRAEILPWQNRRAACLPRLVVLHLVVDDTTTSCRSESRWVGSGLSESLGTARNVWR